MIKVLRKITDEFRNASTLEKFNTLGSIFTISGVSLLTIFNALGGVNLLQLTISFLVFGFIFMLVSVLLAVDLMVIKMLKPSINPIVFLLLIAGMVLIFLGILIFSILSGIDFIKSFENY